jgi:cytochrome c peroxidase
MKRKFVVVAMLVICVATIYSCAKNNLQSLKADEYIEFKTYSNFPKTVYNFDKNALTTNGFKLGKMLFYEARLSSDKSVSCGSCHQQFAAFANLDHKVSHGVNNCLGKRNAPPLFNLAWQNSFFWDGGGKNLEFAPLNAITDHCEMNTDIPAIISFLKSTAPYPTLFEKAFGSQEINSQLILKSIAQFTAVLVSGNSKYDKIKRNEMDVSFNDDEIKGYRIVQNKCTGCHREPLFTDQSFRNNGLDFKSEDDGRALITGLQSDIGKFRVPSLRNIEYTAPYMHDGRFYNLDEVLEHYNSGIKQHPNLDPELKNGIVLSSIEKQQIKAFLKTLTDYEFIKNPVYSEN